MLRGGTINKGLFPMKRILPLVLAGLLAATAGAGTAQAEAGGCLKYGAVGAVGGHVAHHGILGAAGGCATGMWVRHKARQRARAQAAAQAGYGAPDQPSASQPYN